MMVSQFANRVIVHALPFKQEYEMMDNLPGEFKPTFPNIEFIPMGCEPPQLLHDSDVTETRRHLNMDNRSPIVGSFGFLRDQKGYNELLLAVKELKVKYPQIYCLIYAPPHEFGSKFYDEEFFKFIEREKLEDMVLVVRDYSEKEKMLRILQTADLFVLNYKDSPQGGGISAAVKTLMRTQRPIIVADSIAFRDLDKEVVKIGKPNVQKIASTIDQVWMNEMLKSRLVEKANLFLNNNTWDKIATKHLKIYGD
jgi:glycosyltransferase involved in cell wall biosynthesis